MSIWIAKSPQELRKSFHRTDDDVLKVVKPVFPKRFDYVRENVVDLEDMYALLLRLTDESEKMIVQGEPRFSAGDRTKESFLDVPSDFWFLDLDGAKILDGETPENTVRRLLPFLAGKAFVLGFTSSAGLNEGLRARIVCRVHAKRLVELESWTRQENSRLIAEYGWSALSWLDTGIYAPCSAIFTARPKFSGIDDPYPERVVLMAGDLSPVHIQRPEMVEIIKTGDVAKFTTLPTLAGEWNVTGDGHDRSRHAIIGISALRTYMESIRHGSWGDAAEREDLWIQMLEAKGASADSLEKYGRNFIRLRARGARLLTSTTTRMVYPNRAKEMPLPEGRKQLDEIIQTFMKKQSGICCIVAPPGTGKTFTALKHLATFRRYTDENRSNYRFADLNIDYFGPTVHFLEEACETAKRHGIDGFIEYGRQQQVSDVPVCFKAEAAKAIQGVVNNVAEHLCESGEERCEYFSTCRWNWQRHQTQRLPLRLRTHERLALPSVSAAHDAFRPVDFVVIDESSFALKMRKSSYVEISELTAKRLPPEHDFWVRRFAELVPEGLTLERLLAAGLTSEIFAKLATAEDALKPSLDVSPIMSPAESYKRSLGFDANAGWYRFATAWRRLRECIDNGSMNRATLTADRKGLVLSWRQRIMGIPWDKENDRPAVPVLILSATMRREVVEQFFDVGDEDWHEIEVAPHPASKIEMMGAFKGSKAESLYGATEERRAYERKEDKRAAAAEVRREICDLRNPKALLITYLELEEILDLPPSTHFNAVQGLNAFSGKDIDVFGRPMPWPTTVEDIAAGIFCDGEPIKRIQGWYPLRPVEVRGQNDWVNAAYHPDPRVEAIRWTICEAEIMQAVGRSRYSEHPVTVRIFNPVSLPLTITSVHDADLPRKRVAAARFIPTSHRELVKLFRFNDGRSAERAFNRESWADQKIAYHVSYRKRGITGKWAPRGSEGYAVAGVLGDLPFEVKDFTIPNNQHNRWVTAMHESLLAFDDGSLCSFAEEWLEDVLSENATATREERVTHIGDAVYELRNDEETLFQVGLSPDGLLKYRRCADDPWQASRWPWVSGS